MEAASLSTSREPGKLPGLVRIFRVGLWLGFAFSILGGLFLLVAWFNTRYLDGVRILLFSGTILLFVLAAVLSARAAMSIGARLSQAPGRCRTIMTLNLVSSVIGSIILLFIFLRTDPAWPDWRRFVNEVPYIVCALIICEAWRRYFVVSPKVRETFNTQENTLYPEAVVPGEIGLLKIGCWLIFAHGALRPAGNLLYFYLSGENVPAFILLCLTVDVLTNATIPFFILHALAVRVNMRSRVFLALGIWIASHFIQYGILFYGIGASLNWQLSLLQYQLPQFLRIEFLMALVFWWYLSVSEKARIWFEET